MELCSYNFEEHLNGCKGKIRTWDWWFLGGRGVFSMELELNVLDGLVFIHSMNEIHRDLKPANILLSFKHQSAMCKIADFGFTSDGESGQQYSSRQGRMTVIYSAPELIIHGHYSKKSDIWAMGCILYEVCFASHDRRKAFPTMTSITSYYFNETASPPQIGWENLGISSDAIPEEYRQYRDMVEKRWNSLNIIFAAVFRRKPEERPTALELRDNFLIIAKGGEPTLTDYRLNQT